MIKYPYSLLVLFKFSIFSCLGLGRILILGIYPFLSGYPICWPIIFHNNLYGLLYFCSVSCNISSFIYNFINFSLLSFFYYSSRHDWLSDFTFTFHFHALEKEMATHSSVLAWRIPGTGEPGGLPSMGLYRVGTTEVT